MMIVVLNLLASARVQSATWLIVGKKLGAKCAIRLDDARPLNRITPMTSENETSSVEYQAIALSCQSGACPTVYQAEAGGSLIIQGYAVAADRVGVDIADGELLVEIPASLLSEAARNLR
ncbi:hypothetical protein [Actinoplanes sp. CA-252034]|uniref:hypothetical protein n=1 Tax=Actinoplanes sp. CA-252034 TaxID=3239906 RepID=UPI003D9556B9